MDPSTTSLPERFIAAIDVSDLKRLPVDRGEAPWPPALPTPEAEGHVITWHKVDDIDMLLSVRNAVAVAVAAFRMLVKERGVSASDFDPLPPIPIEAKHIDYHPAILDGIPVRVMMSYSYIFQAYQVVIDALHRTRPGASPAADSGSGLVPQ